MKLELKHLAPYLPYDVMCVAPANQYGVKHLFKVMDIYMMTNIVNYDTSFKPMLRPLDLTQEIEHNGERFVPIERLTYWFDFTYLDTHSLYIYEYPYNVVEKLFEWKFDYFDLIPNNLAIDINTITNDI